MENKNIVISKQRIIQILENLNINPNFKKTIGNMINEDVGLIDHLINMCEVFDEIFKHGHRRGAQASAKNKAAYSLGAQIVFNLRKLVTQHDIMMYIGCMYKDKDGEKHLAISKDQSLTGLLSQDKNFYISKYALELEYHLEHFNAGENGERKADNKMDKVWKRILATEELNPGRKRDFGSNKKTNQKYTNSSGKKIWLYKRYTIDEFVYYSYSTEEDLIKRGTSKVGDSENLKGNRIYKYYRQDKDFIFFNNGWLWEHFLSKWLNSTEEEQEYVEKNIYNENTLLGKHPVGYAIEGIDNTPGIKGGDVQVRVNENDWIDYQMKYGNQQIITKKSIRETMAAIKNILMIYKNEQSKSEEKALDQLSEGFVTLFTEDNNMIRFVEDNIEKTKEKMIKDFKINCRQGIK